MNQLFPSEGPRPSASPDTLATSNRAPEYPLHHVKRGCTGAGPLYRTFIGDATRPRSHLSDRFFFRVRTTLRPDSASPPHTVKNDRPYARRLVAKEKSRRRPEEIGGTVDPDSWIPFPYLGSPREPRHTRHPTDATHQESHKSHVHKHKPSPRVHHGHS